MRNKYNIDLDATFEALKRRKQEDICDKLTDILGLLYHEQPDEKDRYTQGWNTSRRAIRNVLSLDDWVIWEYKQ